MEYNPLCEDADGNIVPMFRMLFRIEIPRSDFTYVNAMNKIIELNQEYKFDWITIDRGYGRLQLHFIIVIWYYLYEVIKYDRNKRSRMVA